MSAGGLTLTAPTAWRTTRTGAEVQALGMRDAVELRPPDGVAGRVLIGRVNAKAPGYLPERLERELPRQVVSLGDVQAYRHRGLSLEGENLDLYVVPHRTGASGIACIGRERTRSCARLVATTRSAGIKPLGLMPSSKYAGALGAAFDKLANRRASPLERLRTAESPLVQAAAAAELRDTHEAARRSIGRAPAPLLAKAADEKLIAALGAAADAYDRLAKAARAGNESPYDRARSAAVAAEDRLDRAMNQLEALGYTVR